MLLTQAKVGDGGPDRKVWMSRRQDVFVVWRLQVYSYLTWRDLNWGTLYDRKERQRSTGNLCVWHRFLKYEAQKLNGARLKMWACVLSSLAFCIFFFFFTMEVFILGKDLKTKNVHHISGIPDSDSIVGRKNGRCHLIPRVIGRYWSNGPLLHFCTWLGYVPYCFAAFPFPHVFILFFLLCSHLLFPVLTLGMTDIVFLVCMFSIPQIVCSILFVSNKNVNEYVIPIFLIKVHIMNLIMSLIYVS